MNKSNVYSIVRNGNEVTVTCNGETIDARHDLRNHSPDGFEYGYYGSGPAQLALAILSNEYGDSISLEFYQVFKNDIIAVLNKNDNHKITSDDITNWSKKKTGFPT